MMVLTSMLLSVPMPGLNCVRPTASHFGGSPWAMVRATPFPPGHFFIPGGMRSLTVPAGSQRTKRSDPPRSYAEEIAPKCDAHHIMIGRVLKQSLLQPPLELAQRSGRSSPGEICFVHPGVFPPHGN